MIISITFAKANLKSHPKRCFCFGNSPKMLSMMSYVRKFPTGMSHSKQQCISYSVQTSHFFQLNLTAKTKLPNSDLPSHDQKWIKPNVLVLHCHPLLGQLYSSTVFVFVASKFRIANVFDVCLQVHLTDVA